MRGSLDSALVGSLHSSLGSAGEAQSVDAIASCLAIGDTAPDELDAVAFHEKPLAVTRRDNLHRSPTSFSSRARSRRRW